MPTVYPSQNSNLADNTTPSNQNPTTASEGPRVVLPTEAAPAPVTPPPAAAMEQTVSAEELTPTKKEATTDTPAMTMAHQHLQEAEDALLKQLDELTIKESGWLEKMKELVTQTNTAETDEGKLQKQLLMIQNARKELLAKPDNAESILESAKQVITSPAAEPTTEAAVPEAPAEEQPQPIPPATAETPALSNEQTAVTVEAEPAVEENKEPIDFISLLHGNYASDNPIIEQNVVEGAAIYVTPEYGILVEHAGNAIYFTPEDIQAINVSVADLMTLPQKTTSHLPAPAVNHAPDMVQPEPEVPATPTVPTPEPAAVPQPVATTPEPVAPQPIQPTAAMPQEATPVEQPAPEATPDAAAETTEEEAGPMNFQQVADMMKQPQPEATPETPAAPEGMDIKTKLRQLSNQSIVSQIVDTTMIYTSPDGNGVAVANGDQAIHISDAELIQANITGADMISLQPAPDGLTISEAPTEETAEATPATDDGAASLGTGGPSPLQPFPQMPATIPQAATQPMPQQPMQPQQPPAQPIEQQPDVNPAQPIPPAQ